LHLLFWESTGQKAIVRNLPNEKMSGSAQAASDSRGASAAPDFAAIPIDLLRWLYEQNDLQALAQ
jgi:hypothetical protein